MVDEPPLPCFLSSITPILLPEFDAHEFMELCDRSVGRDSPAPCRELVSADACRVRSLLERLAMFRSHMAASCGAAPDARGSKGRVRHPGR
mmetsp:Transcript_95770/g.270561  ORF Transcript_95770/g.270561 Transcript_95770/m.270561 type:complete len:91 (-) Transcript_95770:32-304(-)